MPKRIGFMPTIQLEKLIQEIMERRGYSTKAQVIIEGVNVLYNEVFPGYLKPKNKPTLSEEEKTKIEEEKAKARLEQEVKNKEMKKLAKRQAFVDVAFALGGQIMKNDSGGEICKYYKYANGERYLQEVPLSRLSTDLIDTQYSDRSREEKLRKEGRVNYPLDKENEI